MLVPFPIVFFVSTFVCDVVFWRNGVTDWYDATLWLLGAGLAMAALAAIAGLVDFLDDRLIRSLKDAWLHMGGNVLAVLIEAYNLYGRATAGESFVRPTGLVLSTVVVALLLFTGWKGGSLVYRHHVAVTDTTPEEPHHR